MKLLLYQNIIFADVIIPLNAAYLPSAILNQ